ncbi:MAG TPA: methyltransferase domain-containing protein [Firmicutes bacterium]|nr:methyltransferase domain-containing protein [Bacillota bacterium]
MDDDVRGLNRFARWFYNCVSPRYDGLSRKIPKISLMRRDLVGRLNLKPGARVLEVSVGTGANLPIIAERILPGGRITGIDISEGMLERARTRAGSIPCPVELFLCQAEALPFPDRSFDAVLHLGGINFFSDRRRAILEMCRVARPGAKIVISDETIWPGRHPLLGPLMLALFPRLNPPVDMVPPAARFEYLLDGHFYVLEWENDTSFGLNDISSPGEGMELTREE